MHKLLLVLTFTASVIFAAQSQDYFEAPDFAYIERNVKSRHLPTTIRI